MNIGDTSDSNWFVECSDDEKYKESKCPKGKLEWMPKAQEVAQLFDQIETNPENVLELDWKCPGRRAPSPPFAESSSDEEEAPVENKGNDFDFEDDFNSTPSNLTPVRRPFGSRELKGSARKKTTSFNSVLSNMKRHANLKNKEDGSQTPTSSKT